MTEMVSSTANWRDERDQPQARVLLDSISDGPHHPVRLTTFEVTMHRFVLAEFNTHRVFSRNSASSRAIPFEKQVAKVVDSPAIPVEWRAEQSGMQGGDLFTDDEARWAESDWLDARDHAVKVAKALTRNAPYDDFPGRAAHKSIVNRILEPFLWHTVIVTATEWDGFWAQRCSALAQPEIRVAAEAMKEAYDASEPTELSHGQWHTPLIQPSDDFQTALEDWDFRVEEASRRLEADHPDMEQQEADLLKQIVAAPPLTGWGDVRKAVSAARCARVSYLTHDGRRDIKKDLELFARLATADPGHWSPFEHVATPCPNRWGDQVTIDHIGRHLGNFRGWDQFRHAISGGSNA